MATEVESAWSPAKRFTLVKPTFKGLEQAVIQVVGGPVAISGNGDLLVLGNPGYPLSGAFIHYRENSAWSLKATISKGLDYVSGSGVATSYGLGSNVWASPDGSFILIGSLSQSDLLVETIAESRVLKYQKETLDNWNESVAYPAVGDTTTYRFMNSSEDYPQPYLQQGSYSSGWISVFGASYQTGIAPTVQNNGVLGAVSIPAQSKIVAVKKVGSSYSEVQNINTTAGIVIISSDGTTLINGYGNGIDFYTWSGSSWIFTRRLLLSETVDIGAMSMSRDGKVILFVSSPPTSNQDRVSVLKNINGSWVEVQLPVVDRVTNAIISQDGSTVAITGTWGGYHSCKIYV